MRCASLTALGVDFVSYTQPFDTTTPAGKLSFQILGAVAEFERELMKDRVRAGIARSMALGKPHGRPKADIDADLARARLKRGDTLTAIAKDMGVHRSTLKRRLAA
ncbi:MAG: hypothetical protein CMF76_10210 [Maricaulis sp.]|nr:hypothetical protein [Maricaulis sp.]